MGQKFSEKLQETLKKAKKSLHPQTKVQESLVPPAGIEPARYRYRGILSFLMAVKSVLFCPQNMVISAIFSVKCDFC